MGESIRGPICAQASISTILAAVACPALAQLQLGPEELVQADGTALTVPGYSVPSYVDWNSDGLNDLVVGEGSGTYTANVHVYLNEGTASHPLFSGYFHVQAEGSDLTVPGGG
jgi:hypothetical protein